MLRPPDAPDVHPAARALLNERLTLVPDGTAPASRLPNEVTRAEYEATVRLLSDVAQGHGSLRIDSIRAGTKVFRSNELLQPLSPALRDLFERRSLEDLATLLQTASGRSLIQQLVAAPHRTTVVLNGNQRPEPGAQHESGEGTGATWVRYLPGVSMARADWSTNPEVFTQPWEQVNPSHVVLFHELTHALGEVSGAGVEGAVSEAEAATAADVGVALEEYRATGLGPFAQAPISENAYRRERAQLGAHSPQRRPLDERMAERVAYRSSTPAGAGFEARDFAFAELFVASMIGPQPPSAVDLAWAQRNGAELATPSFLAAVEKLLGSSLRAEVQGLLESKSHGQLFDAWKAAHGYA